MNKYLQELIHCRSLPAKTAQVSERIKEENKKPRRFQKPTGFVLFPEEESLIREIE